MDVTTQVSSLTTRFPKEDHYGLTSQIRRFSISIPSRIADGAARQSTKECIQFLHRTPGSVAELETPLLSAVRMEFIFGDSGVRHSIEEDRTLFLGRLRSLKKKLVTCHPSLITAVS